MRLKVLLINALIFLGFADDTLLAQEVLPIRTRLILIGDAGELNKQQQEVIEHAVQQVIPEKTTVLFLGDNVYPSGMPLSEAAGEARAQEILRAQFNPFRTKGAPVYFIPGNHDWDNSGKRGLAKIVAQHNYLKAQNDPQLQLLPAMGCPDPVEVPISENLTIIAYDSEWLLFPYKKSNNDTTCNCETREEVVEYLGELLYKNRHKTVLLASHHPFETYGVHGGKFSLKDHLFPLTNLNKHLFFPLPLLGSLYPILRSTVFLQSEDLHHPNYQLMKQDILPVIEEFPNLLLAAGHEHGLQLIRSNQYVQIVSGGGAKGGHLKKTKNTLYKAGSPGFVIIDELADKSQQIKFHTIENNRFEEAFSYNRPYIDEPLVRDSLYLNSTSEDSIITQANTLYNQPGKFHRKLFGENYRKEWAADTKVPVIRISSFQGGLTPIKRGGGMQTVSLRLVDKTGKEWVMRSVNKNTDALLPKELQETFARDFLDDANSAQHPYSALMLPPLADAVNVPHTNPIIGFIAPDTALGAYNHIFANTLCLVEEREPLGKSDNTIKMLKKINNDNDDIYKAKTFLRARMLDLLVSDWDRHEDQWRWKDEGKDGDEDYLPIPRDRDQAFRLAEGLLPSIMSLSWALPTLQGFAPAIKSSKYSLFKSDFLNAHPKNQFSYDEWMEITQEFIEKITDNVLEQSIRRLPLASYKIRHDELLTKLKERRAAIPEAMDQYYQFVNNIVDIKLSNKHEWVEIKDDVDLSVKVTVRKINKDGERKGKLMEKVYSPQLTKEIRIYLASGNDSVRVATKNTPIKIRIVGGKGEKNYHIDSISRPIKLYDLGKKASFSGQHKGFKKHLSKDSANVAFDPVNLYNVWMPLATAGFNVDDGLMLGGGFKYTHQRGFRKAPFTHQQQLLVSAAFNTGAIKLKYRGQWKEVVGKADAVLDVTINAPNNTQNFFGLGNASPYDRENHSMRYYRARFNLYDLHSALRWTPTSSTSFHIGPSFQLYYYDSDDNIGRFINNTDQLHTYDSLTIAEDKVFAGFNASFMKDSRDSRLLTTNGGYFKLDIHGLTGLNDYSKSFLQAKAEIAIYKSIWQNAITLANRVGGGTTFGKTTFYQSLFLGGQNNLWGYRQFRFAGEHLFFNNFEARVKLAQIGSYILPGQLGVLGFYDIGKVWAEGLNSDEIHRGTGAGVYYSPARIALIQFVAGHSKEGWYPYFTMGFRF